jgi:hypothetical protein
VYVTVAAVSGAALAPDDPIVKNLTEALRRFGDPRLPIIVQSYVPVTFGLTVALKIAGDVDAAATRTAVEAALRAAYAFDARALGQAVALAEVYALIQAVPGVVAANVTDLFRTAAGSSPDGPPLALPAALATVTAGGVVTAAELLTLDAEPLAFGEMP